MSMVHEVKFVFSGNSKKGIPVSKKSTCLRAMHPNLETSCKHVFKTILAFHDL